MFTGRLYRDGVSADEPPGPDPVDRVMADTAVGAEQPDYITVHERKLADARASAIAAGRRKGGATGAAMAATMLALRDIYEGPPREEVPITEEASGEPHDVDRDGIDFEVDDVNVTAPPLERRDPIQSPKHRR